MSKIGQVNLELQEQANELGFETVQEALDNGYEVDYEKQVLIEPQEAAHKAWLKEKGEVLEDLGHLKNIYKGVYQDEQIIEHTIEFIKKGGV